MLGLQNIAYHSSFKDILDMPYHLYKLTELYLQANHKVELYTLLATWQQQQQTVIRQTDRQ